MNKSWFLSFGVLSLLLTFSDRVFAHTINQHVQEMYGLAYLPLFILAGLLPFTGAGVLAYEGKTEKKSFTIQWVFIVCIGIGILFGYYFDIPDYVLLFNRLSIIIIGIVLVMIKRSIQIIRVPIVTLLGLTLGMEYGFSISHSIEFMWLYFLILALGLIIFHLLKNFHISKQSRESVFHITTGIILIITGLFVVLLT